MDRARGGKDSTAARGEKTRVERVTVAVYHLVLGRGAVVERVRERDSWLPVHEGAVLHTRWAARHELVQIVATLQHKRRLLDERVEILRHGALPYLADGRVARLTLR